MEENKICLLIVDDHPVFRSGLKNILWKLDIVDLIHEAANGKQAIDMVQNHFVDVIIMDIDMPGMNGLEATTHILQSHPHIKVICLTMFCEPKMIYGMVKAGVKGYLLKDASHVEIHKAIQMVLKDEEYYSERVQSVLAHAVRDFDNHLPKFNPDLSITAHQTAILKMLCNQRSSEEIATELFISVNTVKKHRQELLERTGARNLAGLVIYAIEHGIHKVDVKY